MSAVLKVSRGGYTPSLAATEMDLNALQVGTYVRFSSNKGYSGWRQEHGRIKSVTARSYVVELDFGDTARIERSTAAFRTRNLRVMLTPTEYDEALAEQAEAHSVHQAEAAARLEVQRSEQRTKQARQRAYEMLAVNHPAEFNRLRDAALLDIEREAGLVSG